MSRCSVDSLAIFDLHRNSGAGLQPGKSSVAVTSWCGLAVTSSPPFRSDCSEEGPRLTARRILDALATATAGGIVPRVSIGICCGGPESDLDRLLDFAHSAMYRAKQRGGTAYVVSDAAAVDRPARPAAAAAVWVGPGVSLRKRLAIPEKLGVLGIWHPLPASLTPVSHPDTVVADRAHWDPTTGDKSQ